MDFMLVFHALKNAKNPSLNGEETILKWKRGKQLSATKQNYYYFFSLHTLKLGGPQNVAFFVPSHQAGTATETILGRFA